MEAGDTIMSEIRLSRLGRHYQGLPAPGNTAWLEARGSRYRDYRREWDRRPAEGQAGDTPLHLDIEATNLCNLKCVMCPRTRLVSLGNQKWSPRGLGAMDMDLYRSLIDRAAAAGVYSIKLNQLGEPLLHPGIREMVAYAHERGLYVMINTNATLLTEDMSARLLEAGLDDMFFSIDSADPADLARIRPGVELGQLIKNIKEFLRLRDEMALRHVRARASMCTGLSGKDTHEEVTSYYRLMHELGIDEVGYGPADDHLADYSRDNLSLAKGFVCEQIFQRMFVTWDGVLVPCCGHWEREYIIGSAGCSTDLQRIWREPVYQRLRQAHLQGVFHRIPICRRCSVPYRYYLTQAAPTAEAAAL